MSTVPQFLLKQHGLSSSRAYRQLKREQLKRTLFALNQLCTGCAYLPDGPLRCTEAITALRKLNAVMAVKQWGR